jgi:hypothetical protein
MAFRQLSRSSFLARPLACRAMQTFVRLGAATVTLPHRVADSQLAAARRAVFLISASFRGFQSLGPSSRRGLQQHFFRARPPRQKLPQKW